MPCNLGMTAAQNQGCLACVEGDCAAPCLVLPGLCHRVLCCTSSSIAERHGTIGQVTQTTPTSSTVNSRSSRGQNKVGEGPPPSGPEIVPPQEMSPPSRPNPHPARGLTHTRLCQGPLRGVTSKTRLARNSYFCKQRAFSKSDLLACLPPVGAPAV
jgi:hypothetical protein